MAFCPKCGSPVAGDVKFCPSCGSIVATTMSQPVSRVQYSQPPVQPQVISQPAYQQGQQPVIIVQQPMMQPMGPKPSSGTLTAAGVLNIINAVIGFIVMGIIFFVGSFYFVFGGYVLYICGAIVLIGAIFSLLAGVYCIKRTNYGLCVAGSVLGMLFCGSFIFGLIALILVVVGRNDFLDRAVMPAPMMYARY